MPKSATEIETCLASCGAVRMVACADSGAGVLWGAAGVLIAIDSTMVQQAFAAFILGGMSDGAIATSASVMVSTVTKALED